MSEEEEDEEEEEEEEEEEDLFIFNGTIEGPRRLRLSQGASESNPKYH